MKTATFDIKDWKSVLDAQCIEHCLLQMHGVHHASANFMSGSVTVHYDETQVSVANMKTMLNEGGFACMQSMPRHLIREMGIPSTLTIDHGAHAGHTTPGTLPAKKEGHAATADPAIVMPTASTPVKTAIHAGHDTSGEMNEMSHEMGHGAGMSMDAMVRDMRNRFLVALVFAVPVFLYSPLFTQFFKINLPVPFGLDINVFAFFLATPPILYSGWIFYAGA